MEYNILFTNTESLARTIYARLVSAYINEISLYRVGGQSLRIVYTSDEFRQLANHWRTVEKCSFMLIDPHKSDINSRESVFMEIAMIRNEAYADRFRIGMWFKNFKAPDRVMIDIQDTPDGNGIATDVQVMDQHGTVYPPNRIDIEFIRLLNVALEPLLKEIFRHIG